MIAAVRREDNALSADLLRPVTRDWTVLYRLRQLVPSAPFITVLVIWLSFTFASFSMSSKANPTLVVVLLACGVAASTALYLILELGQPFDGLLQTSNAGLRRALPPI
ncbi:MAG: hypothetical protein FJX11_03470 [Alphaproteobacteria bacterium]|nr:hypothetical protein [Alphaproteobacteria bacterium]